MTSLLLALSLISVSAFADGDQAECKITQNTDVLDTHGLLDDLKASLTGIRNESETRDYLACRFDKDQSSTNDQKKLKALAEKRAAFKKDYSPAITKAEKAFGIPYSTSACMFYIESEFEANQSHALALGLGQLEDVSMINRAIADPKPSIEAQQKSRQDYITDKKLKLKQLKAKLQDEKAATQAYEDELAASAERIETAIANKALQKMWWDYFGGKSKAPKSLTMEDRAKPEFAIPASILYVRRILSRNDFSNETLRKKDKEAAGIARLSLGVGGYNLGPNEFVKLFHQNGRDLDKTLQYVTKERPKQQTARDAAKKAGTKPLPTVYPDTQCHVKKLQKCMLKSDLKTDKEDKCPAGCKD